MQIEQIDAAEKALAKEFSDYLASVSREVIDPISANITRHQADIEKMLTKVADARSGVESEFGRQRDYLNTVRDQIDSIIKKSELKIAQLNSSSQSLLDKSSQQIISELTSVAGQVGQTLRIMEEENKRTSNAISVHHAALLRITNENFDTTAKIIEDAKVSLNQTFEEHRTSLNTEAAELLRCFDAIAMDVKQTTERLWSVHDETRTRLFKDFSSFMETIRSQIDAIHEALRHEISSQVDRKSAEIVKQIGTGITDQYAGQFAALRNEIRSALGYVNEASRTQGELINSSIAKAIADIAKSTEDSQACAVMQLQKEFSNVKKVIGAVAVVVTAIFSVWIFLRF